MWQYYVEKSHDKNMAFTTELRTQLVILFNPLTISWWPRDLCASCWFFRSVSSLLSRYGRMMQHWGVTCQGYIHAILPFVSDIEIVLYIFKYYNIIGMLIQLHSILPCTWRWCLPIISTLIPIHCASHFAQVCYLKGDKSWPLPIRFWDDIVIS